MPWADTRNPAVLGRNSFVFSLRDPTAKVQQKQSGPSLRERTEKPSRMGETVKIMDYSAALVLRVLVVLGLASAVSFFVLVVAAFRASF